MDGICSEYTLNIYIYSISVTASLEESKNQSTNEPRQAPNLKVGRGGRRVFSPTELKWRKG